MSGRFQTGCLALLAGLVISSTLVADVTGFSDDNNGNGYVIPDNGSIESLIQINQHERILSASFSIIGLDHSWIGDLIISVAHSTSGKTATLMHRVGTTSTTGSTGDSSDVNGTYTFRDGNPSIWTAAAGGDTNYVVPGGTYDASGENEAVVSLDQIFAGETTAGTWTFTLADANGTQEGEFLQTSLSMVSVPEPGAAWLLAGMLVGGFLGRRK